MLLSHPAHHCGLVPNVVSCLSNPTLKHPREEKSACLPQRGSLQCWPHGQRGQICSAWWTGGWMPWRSPGPAVETGSPKARALSGPSWELTRSEEERCADLPDVLQTCFPLTSAQGHKLDNHFSWIYCFHLSFFMRNKWNSCLHQGTPWE